MSRRTCCPSAAYRPSTRRCRSSAMQAFTTCRSPACRSSRTLNDRRMARTRPGWSSPRCDRLPDLRERAVVEVGRGPIQLCSAANGELIVALASGDTTLTVLVGRTAAVRSTIDVGPSPWNAVAQGSLVYVAMHTDAPAECIDAIQV